MNLAKYHVYMIFDIYTQNGINIGRALILINKKSDLIKWKNTRLCEHEAIECFESENPEQKERVLTAFYYGDIIPIVS